MQHNENAMENWYILGKTHTLATILGRKQHGPWLFETLLAKGISLAKLNYGLLLTDLSHDRQTSLICLRKSSSYKNERPLLSQHNTYTHMPDQTVLPRA